MRLSASGPWENGRHALMWMRGVSGAAGRDRLLRAGGEGRGRPWRWVLALAGAGRSPVLRGRR